MGLFFSYEDTDIDVAKISKIVVIKVSELKRQITESGKDLEYMLKEVPYASNYFIETTNFNGEIVKGVSRINNKFYRSSNMIKTHINLRGLDGNCKLGLTEYQFKKINEILT